MRDLLLGTCRMITPDGPLFVSLWMIQTKCGTNAGLHRHQAPASGRRKEPKPCIPLRAVSTPLAWAPESSEAIDAYSSSSTDLADIADELLRSERRKANSETYSPGAERLQQQLALQLEKALRAHGGLQSPALASSALPEVPTAYFPCHSISGKGSCKDGVCVDTCIHGLIAPRSVSTQCLHSVTGGIECSPGSKRPQPVEQRQEDV